MNGQSFEQNFYCWQKTEATQVEHCLHFLILHLYLRHGSTWLSGPRRVAPPVPTPSGQLIRQLAGWGIDLTPKQLQRLSGLNTGLELIENFYLKGVVLDAHEGMVGWASGRYPLILRHEIISPNEMLKLQSQGLRAVTLLAQPHEQFQPQGRHRDACSFLLHDLEHAHKFYADPKLHLGQVHFFKLLLNSEAEWHRRSYDPMFVQELNYLKSDMNSHPVHLLKYLKAIILNAEIRSTGQRQPELDPFWHSLFSTWQMPSHVILAALNLNQPSVECPADQIRVRDFLCSDHVARRGATEPSSTEAPTLPAICHVQQK